MRSSLYFSEQLLLLRGRQLEQTFFFRISIRNLQKQSVNWVIAYLYSFMEKGKKLRNKKHVAQKNKFHRFQVSFSNTLGMKVQKYSLGVFYEKYFLI